MPCSAATDAKLATALIRGALTHAALLAVCVKRHVDFAAWHLSSSNYTFLRTQLSQLAKVGTAGVPCQMPELPACREQAESFPHSAGFFLAALSAGWPWAAAILAFSSLDAGFFSDDNCSFLALSNDPQSPGSWTRGNLCLMAGKFSATVFLRCGKVAFIQGNRPLRSRCHSLPRQELCSSDPGFPCLPDFLALARETTGDALLFPSSKVTTIVERRSVWHQILGPLDGAAAAIVDGHFSYPRDSWDWMPLFSDNHASWEHNLEAKLALGATLAAWLHSGILEYVPRHCLQPLIVEPLGSVPKSTPPNFRLISDARQSNASLGKWPVRCMNIREMAAGLDYGAIMSGDDVNDAYHLVPFGGCTGELFEDVALACSPEGQWCKTRRLYLGCSPRTCLGTCDKARSGCCIEGHMFRFAAAHFGQKLAGSPLNCLFMAIIRHLVRRFGRLDPDALIMCFLWVDDMILARNVRPHDRCGGLSAGCIVCAAAAEQFETVRRYWHDLAEKLGISLSLAKRQPTGQRVEYTGMIVDSIAGRLFIPPKKLEKLRSCLLDLAKVSTCTTRTLLSVRGRVKHYSLCIAHVEPLIPLLHAIGEDPDHLDTQLEVDAGLQDACRLVIDVVDKFAPAGTPLWPFVPSSLYGALLRGEAEGTHVAAISWDSSYLGIGAVIKTPEDLDGTVIVDSDDSIRDCDAQVHREALGGPWALEAASRVRDLSGAVVIFRNDSTGALAALRKGSPTSSVLQASASRLAVLCAKLDIEPLFLHAPGRELVDEGVDDASRRLAASISGPACSASLREIVHRTAASLGWIITVDAFASTCNALVPRYFSEFPEPRSEAVDALAVTDWNTSTCPHCNRSHRETIFAFPPTALIRRFISKARADGIRALVLVPFAITASYWPRLLAACRPVDNRKFRHLRNPGSVLVDASGFSSPSLALFAVDFSGTPDAHPPGCGQETAWRGRPPLGHPIDRHDRLRIRSALEQRLRRLDAPGTSPPPPAHGGSHGAGPPHCPVPHLEPRPAANAAGSGVAPQSRE